MKNFKFIVYFLIAFIQSLNGQIDTQNWALYKVKVSGLQSDLNDEMLSRTLEKKNQAIFSAFNYNLNEGYVIIEKTKPFHDVINFVNNEIQKANIIYSEPLLLNDTLLLEIYALRNNIEKKDLSKQLPPYINLGGTKFQFSNDLYAYVKQIWINLYPDIYRSFITPKPLTPEEEREKELKSIKN